MFQKQQKQETKTIKQQKATKHWKQDEFDKGMFEEWILGNKQVQKQETRKQEAKEERQIEKLKEKKEK